MMLRIQQLSLTLVKTVTVSILLLTVPLGCKEEERYGGTLILSAVNKPEGINPLPSQEVIGVHLENMIFNGLARLNRKGEFVPDLAESWQVSDDGLVWDFRLRRGVRFHDGEELTARDVLFTFNTLIYPEEEPPYLTLCEIMDRFEAAERYQFKVYLKRPYEELPGLLFHDILPAHLFEGRGFSHQEFRDNPIGTGPFKFLGRRDGEIVLAAYKDYFDGRPYLDEILVRFFSDNQHAGSALIQGETDVVLDLTFQDFKSIKNDPRFKTYSYPDGFFYTILFNMTDSLLSQAELREALDLSIDRSDIIEKVLFGQGIEARGPFRPETWPADSEKPVKYDPEEALKLLEQLGWRDRDNDFVLEKKGKEFTFTLLVNRGDNLKEAAAQRIKWQLFQVGIRMEVEFVEAKELINERLASGRFQAVLLQFNTGFTPCGPAHLYWYSSRAGKWNFGGYRNQQIDRLIEQVRATADQAEQRDIYRRIHRIIADERPAVFLFFKHNFLGISNKFKGINTNPPLPAFFYSIKDWYLVEKAAKEGLSSPIAFRYK